MPQLSSAILLSALATLSQAQIGARPVDLSEQCWEVIKDYSFTELNRCLVVPQAMGILVNMNNKSIVESTNRYIEILCANTTPLCPDEIIRNTTKALNETCPTMNSGSAVGVAKMLIYNYHDIRAVLCAKNESTDAFCAVDVMRTIEDSIRVPLDVRFVYDALNGVEDRLDQITKVIDTGSLCTGCMNDLLSNAGRMDYLGADASNSSLMKTARTHCGDEFGKWSNAPGVLVPGESATRTQSRPVIIVETQVQVSGGFGRSLPQFSAALAILIASVLSLM